MTPGKQIILHNLDLLICFATLLKSHCGTGVLQYICCIFSEHVFLRTSLEGFFWLDKQKDSHEVTCLVIKDWKRRASLTSWVEDGSLALVGHPSSNGVTIKMPYPRDFEILGWCPVGPVLPHGEKGEGASLALVGHPSSDGITIKIPYGVDFLHRPASHPIFSYWVG